MTLAQPALQEGYWEKIEISDEDLEFLYNHLLEKETPLTSNELAAVLIKERIRQEIINQQNKQNQAGAAYLPKDTYNPGDRLRFPALDGATGKVISIRKGVNPEHPPFDVLQVEFSDGIIRNFASGLEDHPLNQPVNIGLHDPSLDAEVIITRYRDLIAEKLAQTFSKVPDLVQIAGAWFPRSLLVDVNIGYLNLAEAVLEVENGGPLQTKAILEQIELPTDVNLKLTEFSMNLALQEDDRFDEVGPSGEILWFLKRLEPEGVKDPPLFLRYHPIEVDLESIGEDLHTLSQLVYDEHEAEGDLPRKEDEITVSLIFPHWRAGTIPLSQSIGQLFPTAYEAPRVKFTFVDEDTGKEYPGWVVRPHRYVYGLKDWFDEKEMFPGSLFIIKQSNTPGEVIIKALTKRSTKEWIRTVLVGADGGIVFTMLKQQVSTAYDERMAIAVPDVKTVDALWEHPPRQRIPIEKSILTVMRELVKLSPQGHVHAQELYAAVNIIRRCPPGVILAALNNQPHVIHLGDLYFRLDDQGGEN